MRKMLAGGFCLLLTVVLCACGGGPKIATAPTWQPDANAAALRGLFQFMPSATQVAIGVPSVDALDAQLKTLSEAAGVSTADLLAKVVKNAKVDVTDGVAATLADAGVDTAKPMAVFLDLVNGDMALIASVKGAGQFDTGMETLFSAAFNAAKLKTSWHSFLTGGFPIKWDEIAPWGYFEANGMAFMASSQPLLMGFLERNATPATIAWGMGEYPGKGNSELVMLARVDDNTKNALMGVVEKKETVESLATYFKGKVDEFSVSASLGMTPAYVRLATHKGPSALPYEEKQPLELGKSFPPESYVILNIRKFNGLTGFLGALAASKDMGKDVKKTFNSFSAAMMMLGDEVAIGVVKAADGAPALLAIIPMSSTSLLKDLGLGALGIDAKSPNFTIEDANGYNIRNEKIPVPLTLVMTPTLVVVSTSEQVAKDATASYKAGGTVAPTPMLTDAVRSEGKYGYLIWDAQNLVSSINSLPLPVKLPEAVTKMDLGGTAQSNLTLSTGKEWNYMTFNVSDQAALARKIKSLLP